MLRQDHLQTLKQTHRTASTVMPLVTAGLALMSALIAAQERRATNTELDPQHIQFVDRPRIVTVTTPVANASAKIAAPTPEARVSVIGSAIGFLATLFGTFVRVALGAMAVIALVAIYTHLDKTNRAVLLTVLIVSVLYLTARVARSRQKRPAGR